MTNIFQHAVGMASFLYAITLLIAYLLVIACTMLICNVLSAALSDRMLHVFKRVVSSCANRAFEYLALEPSCEYLNETRDNMRHYKNKTIKSIQLYYRRVPRKLLNMYNKITLGRLSGLYDEMMAEHAKSDHCISSSSNSSISSNNSESMSMPDYLRAHADALPFHCGLIFEMEDGVHLMLDKTSTITLLKMKEPRIKNAVMKTVDVSSSSGSSSGNDGSQKTLGAFLDAGKRRMKDEHWFQWDFKHNCFYITKRLLVKNGLYSEQAHEMTRYYTQMQRLYDASKTFSYSKNLEMFVRLQARTVSCNLGVIEKVNRIIMYSFN
jgi:hypothetical protein